ncbi:indolepyruvate ferredoxin oxidoreductase beta subunit [Caldicoprobacter guelmensis]|uniref:indolepyruvate oxidoreductase subunit beta n=1 Tax=Caldicoprobacter guelmensis TaxID=1170224 RepID=UPI001957C664|nr:indolepyruvate oxidoreductase subunit beta [Caldicoprobacter guelmensis]MBM7581518.1 indolepyruvate ferredoxin oxidoreductase beta subunit [Caldicoprobacter guelmensis]
MDTKSILIVGVGGQGTLLASKVLGSLFMDLGYDVKISEVHGMAQRGGSVVTHVRYGTKVFSPLVEPGTADILLAFEKMEALRWIHFLKEEGRAVINLQEIEPMPVIMGTYEYPKDLEGRIREVCPNVIFFDALAVARELGNIKVTNMALIGVLAKVLGIGSEAWEKAIKMVVPPKTAEVNLKAFYAGYNSSSL